MGSISSLLAASIGGYPISRIVSALLTLIVCLVVTKLILKIAGRIFARMETANERLYKLILTGLKALLYVLTAIITAEALGVNTTSLTALLSVLTLGVTLAAEDILGNVAGGLVILSSHPFALDDYVETNGVAGTVREISLNHTKLETSDGLTVFLPNKELSASKIINYTALGRRRIARTVSISYDAPIETVKTACMEAVAAVGKVLPEPAPSVRLTGYGASAMEYTVYCWAAAGEYFNVSCAVNEALRAAFVRHGVEMTYDHLNVHIMGQ